MVNLVFVSFCREDINNSILLFHTQFVLDLLFFFKMFQSHCFYKVIFIQKSKPITNLNHKERKNEEATID